MTLNMMGKCLFFILYVTSVSNSQLFVLFTYTFALRVSIQRSDIAFNNCSCENKLQI